MDLKAEIKQAMLHKDKLDRAGALADLVAKYPDHAQSIFYFVLIRADAETSWAIHAGLMRDMNERADMAHGIMELVFD